MDISAQRVTDDAQAIIDCLERADAEAGGVVDIDEITGGFNFQAAWATGFSAKRSVAKDNTN